MDETRRILVTGCASGIGRHLGAALLKRGHQVMLSDIDEEGIQAWMGSEQPQWEGRSLVECLDVRDAKGWERAIARVVERFGGLDMVLNIAGYLNPGRVHEMEVEDVDRHFDINAKGVVLGTRAAAQVMVEEGGGHIVNMGSLASLSPVPGLSVYAASKFAVRGFSLSAAEELREHGVAVTVMCLDAVATPMLDLQASREEAALTFSGPGPLSLEDVEEAFFKRVWAKRPLEVAVPRHRGVLARMAGTLPVVNGLLGPMLRKIGRRGQARYRRDHEE